jgi:MFS family permease
MPMLRDLFLGPWRAVLVLGVTQILAWGTLFYPPVMTVPLIAAEHGWSATFTMGGFSLALLVVGLVVPQVGRLIDRHGGHRVMPAGSLLAALGLVGLSFADHPAAYLAVWMLIGVATQRRSTMRPLRASGASSAPPRARRSRRSRSRAASPRR